MASYAVTPIFFFKQAYNMAMNLEMLNGFIHTPP